MPEHLADVKLALLEHAFTLVSMFGETDTAHAHALTPSNDIYPTLKSALVDTTNKTVFTLIFATKKQKQHPKKQDLDDLEEAHRSRLTVRFIDDFENITSDLLKQNLPDPSSDQSKIKVLVAGTSHVFTFALRRLLTWTVFGQLMRKS